jgi:peptidoglycan/LPS O-acetylase OafA/YrhL
MFGRVLHYTEMGFIHWFANMTMLPNALGQSFLDDAYWTLQTQMYFFLFLCFLKLFRLLPRLSSVFITVLLLNFVTAWLGLYEAIFRLPQIPKVSLNILLSFLQFGYMHFFAIGYCYQRLHTGKFTIADGILFVLCVGFEWVHGERFFPLFLLLLILCYISIFKSFSFYSWRPVRFMARISYCYYLLHMVIGFSILHYGHLELGLGANLLVVVTMLFVGILAAVVERFIERPGYRFLKLNPPGWLDYFQLERWFQRKVSGVN